MPIYEFACDACFKRGVVTTWEMELKMEEPKVSFCAKCGGKGKQVILTPPMLGSSKRSDYNNADKMLESAYQQQTGRSPGTKVEAPKEDPELLRAIGMPTTRAHWGAPTDALTRAQQTGASAHESASDIEFGKPAPSIVHISKDDQKSRDALLSDKAH